MDSILLNNCPVELIEDIRRARLQILIEEYGSITALANRIDRQPAQVSQWKNASIDQKTGKPRHMKSDTARRIEVCTGKPDGWMDQPIALDRFSVRQKKKAYFAEKQSSISAEESLLVRAYRRKSRAEQLMVLKLLDVEPIDFAQSA